MEKLFKCPRVYTSNFFLTHPAVPVHESSDGEISARQSRVTHMMFLDVFLPVESIQIGPDMFSWTYSSQNSKNDVWPPGAVLQALILPVGGAYWQATKNRIILCTFFGQFWTFFGPKRPKMIQNRPKIDFELYMPNDTPKRVNSCGNRIFLKKTKFGPFLVLFRTLKCFNILLIIENY